MCLLHCFNVLSPLVMTVTRAEYQCQWYSVTVVTRSEGEPKARAKVSEVKSNELD